MSRGLFISLDGVDGVGKSTQCRLLADWITSEGATAVTCHDPGGTDLGLELRRLLLHFRGSMSLTAEALMFMASRAQLIAEVIQPALDAGKVVISDRFLLANVVYQGHAGGLDPEQLWRAGLFAAGGLEPDVTFVLDLPVELSLTRRKADADRMESRDLEFFGRVRAGFLAEASRRPDRCHVIDAAPPADQVQARLREILRGHQL